MATIKSLLANYATAILVSALIALGVRILIVEAFVIPTDFMAPTLLPGDHIFVNKLSYKTNEPKAGDIVIFTFPNDPKKEYIKRVIAGAGDTVEIKQGQVFINEKNVSSGLTEEVLGKKKYQLTWETVPLDQRKMIPVSVPAGHIFVLGDNRAKGQDSRTWGFLPTAYVKGKAWLIWFARDRARIFQKL